jgi:hypothetical protein
VLTKQSHNPTTYWLGLLSLQVKHTQHRIYKPVVYALSFKQNLSAAATAAAALTIDAVGLLIRRPCTTRSIVAGSAAIVRSLLQSSSTGS